DRVAHGRAAGVEVLAERHDVHAVLTERGTHGRRRVRFAGRKLQLDVTSDLFLGAHLGILAHSARPLGPPIVFRARSPAWRSVGRGIRGRSAQRFSTCEKSNSTGVGRPKMLTMTLSFCLSGLTSWTVPEKFANAPTTTRTSSPSAN